MTAQKGNLTASMAILGLLIQQPDTTTSIKKRLDREYPHGRWARSIAHNNIKNLANHGLICRIQRGRIASEDLYEATPEGIAAFRALLSKAAKEPPAVRDALQLWVANADESELPEILKVVKELEEIARAEYSAAMSLQSIERNLGNFGPLDGSDWNGRKHEALLDERVMRCGQQALRLKKLREKLQNKDQGLHAPAAENGDG